MVSREGLDDLLFKLQCSNVFSPLDHRIHAPPPLRRLGCLFSGGGVQPGRQGQQILGRLEGQERQQKVELTHSQLLLGLQRWADGSVQITRVTDEMAWVVLQHSLGANGGCKFVYLAVKVDDPDNVGTHHLRAPGARGRRSHNNSSSVKKAIAEVNAVLQESNAGQTIGGQPPQNAQRA